jgi:hypothetical protein
LFASSPTKRSTLMDSEKYIGLDVHQATIVVAVINPRKNALLKDGDKSDRIDSRKLAELLRGNQLKPVYRRKGDLVARLQVWRGQSVLDSVWLPRELYLSENTS